MNKSIRHKKGKDSHPEIVTGLERRVRELEEEINQIRDSLIKSETRLRRAEIASRTGNWELHLKTGMMIGSEGALKLYGLKESPLDYEVVKRVPLTEFRPLMDKALDDLINRGKPYNIEFKIRKADSGEIIDIHSICEYDSENQILFGSIQDITDRKKAEKVIMRNNSDLAQLLQITMDLLETVDKKEVFKRILEGAIRLTELDSGAIYFLNEGILSLEVTIPPMPSDYPDEFKKAKLSSHPHIQKAVTSMSPVIVRDIYEDELSPEEKIIADRRDLHSMIYIPLLVKKEVVGILIMGTISRIYEFTEREIKLSRTFSNITSLTLENLFLFDNLSAAKAKAEESDRLKTAFLRNISHEIRTPLNAIVGFSGFLDQPDISLKERKEYIDIIFESNNQLLSVINDILNISYIETGQTRLKVTPVNINRILSKLYRQFLKEAEKNGIEFRTRTDPDDSMAIIETDEGKLIQILSNLISNSIKFTNAGHVEFGYNNKTDHIEFYVEDTGIGIPESEQSRIFERFYQVDKRESRTFGGMGLGLPISKGFVDLLGGRLWLNSVPGSGSVFYFTIPGTRPAISSVPEEKVIPEPVFQANRVKSILVAEDEESNYALITTILKQYDYYLIRARNGQEAIDQFRMNPDVDLILMDIKMPVKDGFEAASEILKIKPHVPVVAQTAYAHPSDKALAMEMGFTDYLSKPFGRDQLIGIIEKYLK